MIFPRLALFVVLCVSNPIAAAQTPDCYDRALALPAVVTQQMADTCRQKIDVENTTNDRHAIALYNAGRLYAALAASGSASSAKARMYDASVGSMLASRDRASDENAAFLNPWRKGDARSRAAQMAANAFFLANRSYQLGLAYFGLSDLPDRTACRGRDECLDRAATELERNVAIHSVGSFADDYVFLRAKVHATRGQSALARRDFESLANSPHLSASASRELSDLLLADADKALASARSNADFAVANAAYKAALTIPYAALRANLGLGSCAMMQAKLAPDVAGKRSAYDEAWNAFDRAVALAAQGKKSQQQAALEGRGGALFQLGRLGDKDAFSRAALDLEKAANIDTSIIGGPAELMLARALAESGQAANADIAFAEAERRFGADPRAADARSERAFARGRREYSQSNLATARDDFERALANPAWREQRADAHFFISAIDVQLGRDAVASADAASASGDGGSPYREQACLARIAAGGGWVTAKRALANCGSSELLKGLFYLRYAQLAKTPADRAESRRFAQDAFDHALGSTALVVISPIADPIPAADLAAFGYATALSCASAAGMSVPVNLDGRRLAAAERFFQLYRVRDCISSN